MKILRRFDDGDEEMKKKKTIKQKQRDPNTHIYKCIYEMWIRVCLT